MFTPVDPAIKEKVISAYLTGKGRNQITLELHEQGVRVSHGSISNIIGAYKRKHEQPKPGDDAGISTGVPMRWSRNEIFRTRLPFLGKSPLLPTMLHLDLQM